MAFTRDELLGNVAAGEYYFDAWRLSFDPERGADVVFSPPPYMVNRTPDGSDHGTPYDYDNHVPMVWYGPGIRAGSYNQRVGTDSIAPTLAALLKVPSPPLARAPRLF